MVQYLHFRILEFPLIISTYGLVNPSEPSVRPQSKLGCCDASSASNAYTFPRVRSGGELAGNGAMDQWDFHISYIMLALANDMRISLVIFSFNSSIDMSVGFFRIQQMEVRKRTIFGHILWGYSLKFRPEN